MVPWNASQPPSASTPTWPSAGTACSAGVNRLVSRTARMRPANRLRAVSSSVSSSRCSWPKPLTTRTPVTASSTTPATSAIRCWASQLAGNSCLRLRYATNHSAGPMSRATTVSTGDNHSMMMRDSRKSSTFPVMIGNMPSRPCTRVMSEIARLTT